MEARQAQPALQGWPMETGAPIPLGKPERLRGVREVSGGGVSLTPGHQPSLPTVVVCRGPGGVRAPNAIRLIRQGLPGPLPKLHGLLGWEGLLLGCGGSSWGERPKRGLRG